MSIKPENPATQADYSNAIEYLGPLLARSLMYNISGMASRSELDKLSDALKKLVIQHPRAREWLELAMFDPSIPTNMSSLADKSAFIKKVIR